jgi:hypothetical protein
MKFDNGKGTYGMSMSGSVVDRMNKELGSMFLDSLRIETQVLERFYCVSVVDGVAHA